MSNALSVLGISAAAVDVAPLDKPPIWLFTISPFMLKMVAVGICVLTGWCVWQTMRLVAWFTRIETRPPKLLLASVPGRRNTLTPVHILLLFVACQLINFGLFSALGKTMDVGSTWFRVIRVVAAQPSILILGIVLAAYTFPLGIRRGLGLTARRWLYDTFRGVLAYLGVLPICMGLLALSGWILPETIQKKHEILALLLQKAPNEVPDIGKAMLIFGAVVLAPLGEEVFFRGLLQSMARRYTGGAWSAIIISSAVFAAMHWFTPQAIVPLFVLGVVLGYSYEHSGRLYGPILIHALFNAVIIVNELTKA